MRTLPKKGVQLMLTLLCNLAWFLLGGFWLGMSWVVVGLLFCYTIIGIPFGFGYFKVAKVGFAPLGKKVVRK